MSEINILLLLYHVTEVLKYYHQIQDQNKYQLLHHIKMINVYIQIKLNHKKLQIEIKHFIIYH